MFPIRKDEPEYAKLQDKATQEKNRYGKEIKLTPVGDNGSSLCINGEQGIGSNPNRTKQHAFHFTADNCIGCHACEAACSEKNDLPPHLSFRSVGYVEGGTFPDYTRINLSMACNHCDDPVCLKGCPTRAYTKHPEYGAVIQDPDICFGCGYCTWVCPYNAPQLDPVNGQVEKCNMCVDRLEVGLKPACVSACVGNALDFGVVENTPERREQTDVQIPGFPSNEISHPNIRFQQIKSIPRQLQRTDSAAVKYQKDNVSGRYKPVVDKKTGLKKYWNLSRLSSRENPLVMFTLMSQAAIGAFIIAFIGGILGINELQALSQSVFYLLLLLLALLLVSGGLFLSTTHLGKPWRFYRGFNNLRHSPVSREGLGLVLFQGFLVIHMLCIAPANAVVQDILGWQQLITISSYLHAPGLFAGWLATIGGFFTLYYMYRCYRIPARPFWDHWQTATAFFGAMLSVGGLVLAALLIITHSNSSLVAALNSIAPFILAGLLLEAVGLIFHAQYMRHSESEAAVSDYIQRTTFGKSYIARNSLLVANIVILFLLLAWPMSSTAATVFWLILSLSLLISTLISRALFYVLVVPTSMPGAFFWKNKAFEQHARDIGLAANPAVGVALHDH